MIRRFTLHICLLMFLAPLVRAQQSEIYLDTDSLTLGDRFKMTVVLGHDGSRSVLFPHHIVPDSLKTAGGVFGLGDFEILGLVSEGGRPYGNGGRIDSVVYEATTFALDSAYVAGIPLGLVAGADTLYGDTPSFSFPVASLITAEDQSIRDILPLAEFNRSLLPWILGLLALVAVLVGLVMWHRRKNQVEEAPVVEKIPDKPPFEEALERLRGLESFDLDDPANIKPYHVELTDILRTYVGRRTNVPALESTTRELIRKLQDAPAASIVPEDVLREIQSVLDNADLVKFADRKPVRDSSKSLAEQTRMAIEGTEDAYRNERLNRREEDPVGGDGAMEALALPDEEMEEDR